MAIPASLTADLATITAVKTLNRFAPGILAAIIVLSAIVTMFLGRGAIFTGDEIVWIVASPGMDASTALQGHGGHLQLIPRLIYKGMLETVGLEYWPYRLLTVLAMAFVAVGLFRYLRTRIGAGLALAFCALMLFFGSDPSHVVQGNGFTILFATGCGIFSLLSIARDDRRGDVLACLFLILGAATYTVLLPFVVGVTLYLLLGRDWKRLWVPAVPLALYGAWKLWLSESGGLHSSGTLDPANLANLPEWTFDALAAILSAITGFGYGFTDTTASGPDGFFGPALAVLALIAIAWRFSRGSISRGIWVMLSVCLTLFAIQCLAADPDHPELRAAEDPRYMYPGAVVVIMLGADLFAGMKLRRSALALLLLVLLFGLGSNVAQMREAGINNRHTAETFQSGVTATSLAFDEMSGQRAKASGEPLVVSTNEEIVAAVSQRPYGGISLEGDEIAEQSQSSRARIDSMLSGFHGATLTRTPASRKCGTRAVDAGTPVSLPQPQALLIGGSEPGQILLGRFADGETVDLGVLPARAVRRLDLPERLDAPPWRISSTAPGLKVCGTD